LVALRTGLNFEFELQLVQVRKDPKKRREEKKKKKKEAKRYIWQSYIRPLARLISLKLFFFLFLHLFGFGWLFSVFFLFFPFSLIRHGRIRLGAFLVEG
jgi:hypothetical protein